MFPSLLPAWPWGFLLHPPDAFEIIREEISALIKKFGEITARVNEKYLHWRVLTRRFYIAVHDLYLVSLSKGCL